MATNNPFAIQIEEMVGILHGSRNAHDKINVLTNVSPKSKKLSWSGLYIDETFLENTNQNTPKKPDANDIMMYGYNEEEKIDKVYIRSKPMSDNTSENAFIFVIFS